MMRLISLLVLTVAAVSEGRLHRIVNGTMGNICELPHIVFVAISKDGKNFACGGSLIDTRHVLTAAHCLQGNVTHVTVMFGSEFQYYMLYKYAARSFIAHADYEKNDITVLNDVAIIDLGKDIPSGDSCLQPIPLAEEGDEFEESCVIAGWGKTSWEANPTVVLQKGEVPIIPKEECSKIANGLQDQHICAGNQQRDGTTTCRGDSGGPLTCRRKSDHQMVLVGVVSYGDKCDNGMSVFAKVTHFTDWINLHTQQ
ncbi:chymotrypsin-1-like [Argonauta hians]